jgi:predicted dehydrogenase
MEQAFYGSKSLETIGVGLIGTGYMGKCHALAWNAVKPVFQEGSRPRLVHLAEVSAALAAEKAEAFGFERSSADWRAVIADPEVDVVSITTPNQFHAEMAIAALDGGKHVWCEKPMATSFADAQRMRAAARRSGKVAMLGYNYIQNPAIRHVAKLLGDKVIGTVNHVRVEMDEDFMADPDAPFYWKSDASSGYGVLDDFGVHPLSIVTNLLGPVAKVFTHQAKPYVDRPTASGNRRTVETYDIATTLFVLESGASGLIALNRSAWGRKGRITLQIYGSRGSIVFDQERMNELQLYTIDDSATEQGYRTILTAPHHPPYDRFIPAPGHGLGFNELKVIECRQLLNLIDDKPAVAITFEAGIAIEAAVHAMSRSAAEERWITLPPAGDLQNDS